MRASAGPLTKCVLATVLFHVTPQLNYLTQFVVIVGPQCASTLYLFAIGFYFDLIVVDESYVGETHVWRIKLSAWYLLFLQDQYTFIFKCIKDFNDVTDDEDEEPSER